MGEEITSQKIKLVTFALQMLSLSSDVFTSQQIKQYARDAQLAQVLEKWPKRKRQTCAYF